MIEDHFCNFIINKLGSYCSKLIDRSQPHNCFTAETNQIHRLDRFPYAIDVMQEIMHGFIENSQKYAKNKICKFIREKLFFIEIIDLSDLVDQVAHISCICFYEELSKLFDKFANLSNKDKFEDNIANWSFELFQESEEFTKKRILLQIKPFYFNTQLECLHKCLTSNNNQDLHAVITEYQAGNILESLKNWEEASPSYWEEFWRENHMNSKRMSYREIMETSLQGFICLIGIITIVLVCKM